MRILFDTSFLFDLLDRPGRFPDGERRVLTARGHEFFASAVSIWEMRLKHNARYRSGERNSRFSPEDVVATLEDQDLAVLPMTAHHAACQLEVPLGHKDPFDELLLVQAQEERLRLLTVDRNLAAHPLTIALHELE